MKVEVTLIFEGQIAPLMSAVVRFFACMTSVMGFQISFRVEHFRAPFVLTLKVRSTIMSLYMNIKQLLFRVGLAASFKITNMLSGNEVDFGMIMKTLWSYEATLADLANIFLALF